MNAPKLHPSFVELAHAVKEQFPMLPNFRIQGEIERIALLASKASELEGMTVLDLGSGSIDSTDSDPSRSRMRVHRAYQPIMFEPWYCRILHMALAEPTAVDIHSNEKENFNWIQGDLTQPEVWKNFQDNSFDAANNYFFTARRGEGMGFAPHSPTLLDHFEDQIRRENKASFFGWELPFVKLGVFPRAEANIQAWALNDQLDQQLKRVVKPGGLYTHNYQRIRMN